MGENAKIRTNTQFPNNKIILIDSKFMSHKEEYRITHNRYSLIIELQNITNTGKSSKPSLQNKKYQFTYHDIGVLPQGVFKISEESDEDCIIIYFDEKI